MHACRPATRVLLILWLVNDKDVPQMALQIIAFLFATTQVRQGKKTYVGSVHYIRLELILQTREMEQ